jgi:hypothetical protein
MCMFIYTFTNLNTNVYDSKDINIQDFPALHPVTHHEYQFCFRDMYFIC